MKKLLISIIICLGATPLFGMQTPPNQPQTYLPATRAYLNFLSHLIKIQYPKNSPSQKARRKSPHHK